MSSSVVMHYGRVRATLEARGRRKDDFDLLIACTALDRGGILVTNDGALKDAAIAGLRVEDWLAAE